MTKVSIYLHSYIRAVADNGIGISVLISQLAIVMSRQGRVDTAYDRHRLGHKEGIVSYLVLLSVGIMIGVESTLLHIYLKSRITACVRQFLTCRNDIVERIAQTVERIQHTRTHLAVQVSYIVVLCVILQTTCYFGVQQVGMHHIQTTHQELRIDIDAKVLIDRAGTDLDKVIILDNKFFRSP